MCLVLVEDSKKLKRVYKRFISKNIEELKKIDIESKMFEDGKFSELKGSCLTPEMKRSFVEFFCRNNLFKVLMIEIDNEKANPSFYKNTARAFNYILKLALEHLYNIGVLKDNVWDLQIDERNVKTGAKYNLQEFLMTELVTGKNLTETIQASYFDSSNNMLIQIADVFANLYYSNYITKGMYQKEFDQMLKDGYLIKVFKYPPNHY